jgi:hypothetical protein
MSVPRVRISPSPPLNQNRSGASRAYFIPTQVSRTLGTLISGGAQRRSGFQDAWGPRAAQPHGAIPRVRISPSPPLNQNRSGASRAYFIPSKSRSTSPTREALLRLQRFAHTLRVTKYDGVILSVVSEAYEVEGSLSRSRRFADLRRRHCAPTLRVTGWRRCVSTG